MPRKILLQSFLSLSLGLSTYAVDKEKVEAQPILTLTPLPTHKLLSTLQNELRLRLYVDCIIGPDVFLRPLFPNDHPHFRPIFTDPKVMEYFGNGQVLTPFENEARTKRLAGSNQKYYAQSKVFSILKSGEEPKKIETYHWAMITHSKIVGFGIAGMISIVIPNMIEPKMELAYCIAPAFGGRGLTTQGSRLVLEAIPVNFVATVDPKNVASRKILEKLGFIPDDSRQGVKKYGTIRDYYLLLRNKV